MRGPGTTLMRNPKFTPLTLGGEHTVGKSGAEKWGLSTRQVLRDQQESENSQGPAFDPAAPPPGSQLTGPRDTPGLS